ncbi:MAG: hypothetical protein WED10_15035 [Brumimicrobium sp.]
MMYKFGLIILVVSGLFLSVTSCTTVHFKSKSESKKSTNAKKKRHPHGGPPGQTKKSKKHPGKRHLESFYFVDDSLER